jgi:uncharacterized damage-inducible protein DinB
MSLKSHFELMARYNQWMNAKIYDASSRLDTTALHADKGAFFGSVFGTLNHLLVADTIWLKRFAEHQPGLHSLDPVRPMPHPYSLSEPLHGDFKALRAARQAMDDVIVGFCVEAGDDDYARALNYTNRSGEVLIAPLGSLMQHFFNHQAHHRGQVTTLLTQAGIDVGVTDLVALLRERQVA